MKGIRKIFFLFLHKNVCCEYSLESLQWGVLMSTHNIWAVPCNNMSSAYAESLDSTECMNGDQRLGRYIAHVQDYLNLSILCMLEGNFSLDAFQILLYKKTSIFLDENSTLSRYNIVCFVGLITALFKLLLNGFYLPEYKFYSLSWLWQPQQPLIH